MQKFIRDLIELLGNIGNISAQTANEIEEKINDFSSESEIREIEID